jgi:hypothetical protein
MLTPFGHDMECCASVKLLNQFVFTGGSGVAEASNCSRVDSNIDCKNASYILQLTCKVALR